MQFIRPGISSVISRKTRAIALLFGCLVIIVWTASASGQPTPSDVEQQIDQALEETESGVTAPGPSTETTLNLFTLIKRGGWLMLPIGAMSILVVTLVIERLIALRRERVMPSRFVRELGELGSAPGPMDPRSVYRLCQRFPSSAAVVIRAMLLKTGRPQSEVEHAVAEASEREAERMYANVRWLNLVAAVAPLIGLFGTVWGMIQAFYVTTRLAAGQNKADFLAQGIYVALVTTLGGLAVAIPAAIFAHYFEGRIQSLFHEIDEMLFSLLPQVERFEGRMRVTPQSLENDEGQANGSNAATTPDAANIA